LTALGAKVITASNHTAAVCSVATGEKLQPFWQYDFVRLASFVGTGDKPGEDTAMDNKLGAGYTGV